MAAKTLGIVGGGQLGRMLALAARPLNVNVIVVDPDPACPAHAVADDHIVATFGDADAIRSLAARCDVITVEIEHINTAALAEVAAAAAAGSGSGSATGGGQRCTAVHPAPATLALVQDKFAQKEFLKAAGVPCGDFAAVSSPDEVRVLGRALGYPLMLKARRLAYDGRGNQVVASAEDVERAWGALQAAIAPAAAAAAASTPTAAAAAAAPADAASASGGLFYVERWVPFAHEVAVVVAKDATGKTLASYDPVLTRQRVSVCHTVVAPAPLPAAVLARATAVAEAAVRQLDGAGVFGVELFVLAASATTTSGGGHGDVLFNEVAPRVHNSGHLTIEACHTSQFEQHVRAVMGLALGSTGMRVPAAIMLNILGAADGAAGMEAAWGICSRALATPRAALHWYGKGGCRRGRKMGHVTITGTGREEVEAAAAAIEGVAAPPAPPVAAATADGASTAAAGAAAAAGASAASTTVASPPSAPPLVSIIMGSDSDLPVMSQAAAVLAQFGVPCEVTVVSAHRTPDRMVAWARAARGRGIRVVIAGAGGAAHLPGMVAALTPLPVVGVPVPLKHLDGVDSLHSIVQMPRGIPVATVAIGNATNAGLLAVRILSTGMPHLLDALEAYAAASAEEVVAKAGKLEAGGWEAYMAGAKGLGAATVKA